MKLRRMLGALIFSAADAAFRLIWPLAFALIVIAFVGRSADAAADGDVAAADRDVAHATDLGSLPIAPIPLVSPPDRSADLAALQRGARLFGTYCASCHDARMVHYGQLRDLGFSQAQIDAELNPTGAKARDPMLAAMHAVDAVKAFGAAPPDLSLEARAKGSAWLYTYLRNFYADPTRPSGSNNLLVPNVAMPDVLVGLHGEQIPVFAKDGEKTAENGKKTRDFEQKPLDVVAYRLKTTGSMSPTEYDGAMADLVAYMNWLAEPAGLERRSLGPWVIGFLLIFCFASWRLMRSYWNSVNRKD